ncbi:MAG: response regulator [Lewinellaceae bacterium]|nr:response regulator [Lewinellaceae bacterium]
MQRILTSLFLLCLACPLSAQVTHIDRLTAAHGLPSDLVNCVLQDREGFLWIGTADGLCRYDGYTFRVYRYDPDDPYSIAANAVETLFEDRNGTLWAGLAGGLSRFDKQTERFTSYIYRPDDSTSINAGSVNGIYEDPKGRFWITAWNGGLQEMDRARGTFRCYFPEPEADYRKGIMLTSPMFPDASCTDCFFVALAVSGKWRLFSFNGADKTFMPCPSDSLPPVSYLWDIFDDDSGMVWFVTSGGLRLFDPKTRTFSGLESMPEDFQKMWKKQLFSGYVDVLGQMWLGTLNDGMYVFDKQKRLVAHYLNEPDNPVSLSGNTVRAIHQDRSGIVWVGTTTQGLNRITRSARLFRNFRPVPESAPAYAVNSITALFESRSDAIWVGTENTGLLRWDTKTGAFRRAGQVFPELDALTRRYIFSLCESRDNQLWIGMNGHGLVRFDPTRRTVQVYVNNPADSTSLSADYVNALLEDRAGRLWAGTYRGLDRYDPETGRFVHYYLADPGNPANHFLNQVTCLYEDKLGAIWVGTAYGLSLLNPATGGFRHFLRIKKGDNDFQHLGISAISRDESGTIWAGTENGLYRLDFPDPANPSRGTPTIRRFTEADGLPNQRIFSIATDGGGRLWLNTLRGISVLRNPHCDDRTPPEFKNYSSDDGLLSPSYARSTCMKSRSGHLYFGGRDGFDVFHPDSIPDDQFKPPLVFTALEKFDTDRPDAGAIPEKGMSARSEVVLSYKNNIFTIEFGALDFRAPDKIRYAYRLLGFSDTWVQLGAQRRVTFTNLDPGKYTFQVRGTNSDGVWNDTPASLKIVITPPWWKTVWAYLAYALLFAAAVAGFVRARVRYLENRTRELERAVTRSTAQILEQKETLEKQAGELRELDRLKSRFYANITHELRTPLTLMLGPLNSVLKNWKADPAHQNLLQIAQNNGRKLLHLISEILDLGKLDANRMTVEKSPVVLQPLLARLVGQFDSHARYLGVNLTCRCDLSADRMVLLDAKKFETVVNNLLSNALKFTQPGGSVRVELIEKTDTILLTVRDTGRGIHPEDLPHVFDRYFQTRRPDVPVEGGTGIGLALSAELVRLCGGRIWVDSTVGEGSVFLVAWPPPAPPPQGEGGLLSGTVGDFEVDRQDISLQSNQLATRDVSPLPIGGGAGGGVEPTIRILVAEDNPDLQQYLLHLLAPEYDVTLVGNGEEALAVLNPTPGPPGGRVGQLLNNQLATRDVSPLPIGGGAGVDLIISDIMMPRMDGFQLLEYLKNDDRYRHIPMVMLTARADMQDKLRALRTGVDDYLTKPFDEEELLTRVRNLVQRRKNRMEVVSETEVISPRIARADAEWLAELETWTRTNLHDEFLTVSAMAHQAALSERQLLRRMRELTGLSPQQYIGEMRLQKARESLEQGTFRTVAEAAYAAGFGNAKAFSRAYRERFGRLPSSYF